MTIVRKQYERFSVVDTLFVGFFIYFYIIFSYSFYTELVLLTAVYHAMYYTILSCIIFKSLKSNNRVVLIK